MKKKITFTREEAVKLTKAAQRNCRIKSGIGVRPSIQLHKSKKDYTRKGDNSPRLDD